MGIRIDGASDLINATDGSLTIEGQSINSTGIGTFSGGVKVGTAATIHSTGQFNIGVAATIFASGNATFAGIVTTAQLGGDVLIEDKIVHAGDTNTAIRFPSADTISFEAGGEEHCRVLETGNFLVGATAVEDWDGSKGHRLQVRGTSGNNAGMSVLITANDDNASELVLGKSRSTGNTIVGSADDVGQIRFSANDGAGFHSIAWIRGSMDGTPGSDDLPSKLTFGTSADGGTTVSERLRIDSGGRLLIGTAANQHNSGDLLQLAAESSTASLSLNRYTANAHPSYVNFFKSRNASLSGQTVVQDGDTLGLLAFYGSDGTDRALGAEVCAQVDGTPGSDDMPSRLVFRTSADGSQSPSERMRITSAGFVGISETTPVCKLDVDGGARFGSANTDKHQDGCIIERSSTDGIVHITAGRASGNYSGLNFYVAGNSGGSGANTKLRHLIDYQGNFKWYDSDGSTLRMHINTSGHIGIKTTGSLNGALLALGVGQGANTPSGEHIKIAPSANMITFLDTASNESDVGGIQLWNTVYNNSSAKLEFYHPSGNTGGMKFYTHDGTALTERVNFTNTGTYNFGHTNNNAGSNGRLYVMSVSGQCTADLHHSVNDNQNVLNIIHGGVGVNGNPTRVMVEWRNFANTAIATIQSNSTTITYGTGSDYRMKENQVDISDGITRVKQLKPYRFNWKSDYGGGDKVDGFFAHEAATVVPEAVQGTKDAVDSNGDIIRQQIDPSKLVPLLTAALQEAITKIETLETKVAALESA